MNPRIQDNKLLDIRTTTELILGGRVLVLSGEEDVLKKLPKGNWIGGTIPYFYLKNDCGRMDKTKVFVTDLTESINDFKILTLNEESLSTMSSTGFENGFNFLILPALRNIHYTFALNADKYADLDKIPLIGLVAGTDLKEFRNGRLSMIFNGETQEALAEDAVVLHCSLLPSRLARIEAVNLFSPSNKFYVEVFEDTFKVSDCLVNGELFNLYQFIKDNEIDISHPLIFNHGEDSINVSIQYLIKETREVVFYSSLFKAHRYYFANKVDNYRQAFEEKMAEMLQKETSIIYNCNSILNYFNGALNKNDIGFSGPATFGEIANKLSNQTFVYLAIDE